MILACSPGVTEANSAGTACSLAWASATATSASARANSEGATVMRPATGISGSSAALSTSRICVPRLAAWRRRWAISGWSLRRNEPTTSTRSRLSSSAMGMPSHGAPDRAASKDASVWRRRKSMFSEPSARTRRPSSAYSSSVAYSEANAPIWPAPKLSRTRDRPWATAWSASAQEASCHLPSAPLIMGADRRSSLFRPSYEKRSRSLIQHSLTASSSNGTTRMTRSPLTWMTRLAPRLSCGLTERRRASSQVRAL